jgi:hydroxyethylthiazole kinase-like uncharacterized protein yjeF
MVEIREWTEADAAGFLRAPTGADHKYSRGVVGMRTGSDAYPGAAVLGVEAAWRTGIGMVRYLGPRRAADLVLARRPETVPAEGRVQAWVIGSGTDAAARTPDEVAALRGILAGEVPVVADAGALDLAAEASAPRVLTPHAGEHASLRERVGLAPVADPASPADAAAAAAGTAATLGVTVLLKGSVTHVAAPDGAVLRVSAPTSWLATAGTGDVLAGILGAVLAARAADAEPDVPDLAAVAATAAWVHGAAGAAASRTRGGGPVTALDVADAVAGVVGELLAPR